MATTAQVVETLQEEADGARAAAEATEDDEERMFLAGVYAGLERAVEEVQKIGAEGNGGD